MSDIVERLKNLWLEQEPKLTWLQMHAVTDEAADTIEALRAENARLRAALKPFADKANKAEQPFAPPYPEDYPLWRAARAAMGESDDYAR